MTDHTFLDFADPACFVRSKGSGQSLEELRRLSEIFDKNQIYLHAKSEVMTRIPKTMHQIWLGGQVPRDLKKLADHARRLHPSWEYTLWDDQKTKDFDFETRPLFEQATCYGQKSDILRAEILKKSGGVYVDLDYELFKPLDVFAEQFDFFGTSRHLLLAHLGWPQMWHSPLVVCNSLFGAVPGHPVLDAYLRKVRDNWKVKEIEKSELSRASIFFMGGFEKVKKIWDTGHRTYLPFHQAVIEGVGKNLNSNEIILPPPFFPSSAGSPRLLYVMPQFWKKCGELGLNPFKFLTYFQKSDEAFGRHISQNRWL